MDKIENVAVADAERLLSDRELELVSGGIRDSESVGIILEWAEVRGLIINWAASCSNNL